MKQFIIFSILLAMSASQAYGQEQFRHEIDVKNKLPIGVGDLTVSIDRVDRLEQKVKALIDRVSSLEFALKCQRADYFARCHLGDITKTCTQCQNEIDAEIDNVVKSWLDLDSQRRAIIRSQQ